MFLSPVDASPNTCLALSGEREGGDSVSKLNTEEIPKSGDRMSCETMDINLSLSSPVFSVFFFFFSEFYGFPFYFFS